jgi:hypothetical protein
MQQGTLLEAHVGTSTTEMVRRFAAFASPAPLALSVPIFLTPPFPTISSLISLNQKTSSN